MKQIQHPKILCRSPFKKILTKTSLCLIMKSLGKRIAIYGPMIYMAPYVMFLIWENPLLRPLKGLGHESRDFVRPCLGPKKSTKTQGKVELDGFCCSISM